MVLVCTLVEGIFGLYDMAYNDGETMAGESKAWRHWVKGIVSAAIGGAANAITVMIVAPDQFNLEEGLPRLGVVALVSALVSVANYLKQSPLPGECVEPDSRK